MKKILPFLLTSVTFLLLVILYSCTSSVGLEDCNCDDYTPLDTVRVTVVDSVSKIDTVYQDKDRKFYVQIGCFANRTNAEKFARSSKNSLETTILVVLSKDNLYRVMAGEFIDIEKARETLTYVKIRGFSDAFIRDKYGPVEK